MKFLEVIGLMAVLLSYDAVADQEFLHVWKNLGDVDRFFCNVREIGLVELPDPLETIQNTVNNLKEKDAFSLLCILVKVNENIVVRNRKICKELEDLISSIPTYFNGIDLNTPEYYKRKKGWQLFISQTEEGRGEKLIDGFDTTIISKAIDTLAGDLPLSNEPYGGDLLLDMMEKITEVLMIWYRGI